MQLQVQSEYPVDKVTPWIPIAFSGPGNPPIISKHKPYDVSAFVSNDPEPYNEYQVTLAPDAGAEYDACKPIIITGGSQSVNMHGTGNFPPNFEIKSKLDIVDLLALDPIDGDKTIKVWTRSLDVLINITVTSKRTRPIEACVVTILDKNQQEVVFADYTDWDGKVLFIAVEPGDYTVVVKRGRVELKRQPVTIAYGVNDVSVNGIDTATMKFLIGSATRKVFSGKKDRKVLHG